MNAPPPQQRPPSPQDADTSAPEAEGERAQPHPVSATVALLPLMPDPGTPRFEWSTKLLASGAAGPNARYRVRPRITVAHWPGDVDLASRVTDKLVDNAARHGKPFDDGHVLLRLTVLPETEELRIEVDDVDPAFPGFDAVSSNPSHGRGLWWVQHYGGRLSVATKRDDDGCVVGKTVTAVMRSAEGSERA
ncbi:ATP-binding protein [Streptomyces sp. NPDC005727]|uniref:ATP-binding protein n=1 Tax=Streptomyces sp. NPDC005727 TaxID=3157053 RepID=UPI0033FE27F0